MKREIIWRAAEYEHSRKDASWYWILGGVAGALVLIALWQKNFFFALFIVLAGVMVFTFSRRRPQIIEFKIDEEGIWIGKNFNDYGTFTGFSIHDRPGRLDEIVFRKKTVVNPYLKAPIDSKAALKAKEILSEKLPEVEHQESLIEIISDWLGF